MRSITVREWINEFINGEFEAGDFETQTKAGWNDWFCQRRELASRLRRMGNLIKNVENDYILDNFFLVFYNYPLYDQAMFIHSEELLIKILKLDYLLIVLIMDINMKFVLQGIIFTQNFIVIRMKNFLIT